MSDPERLEEEVVEDEVGGTEGGGGLLTALVRGTAEALVKQVEDHLNHTNANVSIEDEGVGGSSPVGGRGVSRHLSPSAQVFITVLYALGILGNLAALYIINKSETQRYRKQTFMLRCLTGNDLAALLGSLILMNVRLYTASPSQKWMCVSRVVIRGFGLGSGCVALVMALERWLALTQPFLYTKHVTQAVIRRTILGLWLLTLLLVCAPFAGFGLWYEKDKCVRYRNGTAPLDRVYAYVIFAYGMVMCAVIVGCNLMVIRVLCRMRERLMPRRHSRSSCRSASSISGGGGDPGYNHATPEELSFAKLMAVLSISFVVCWMPQLMTIIVSQVAGQDSRFQFLSRICDVFILLNFLLDPFMYVLLRRQRYGSRHVTKLLTHLCPSRFTAPPRRPLVTDSMRSSSNVSHNNTNGLISKCRSLARRDIPLVQQVKAGGSRYPPTLEGARRNMCPCNSYSPLRRLPQTLSLDQSTPNQLLQDPHALPSPSRPSISTPPPPSDASITTPETPSHQSASTPLAPFRQSTSIRLTPSTSSHQSTSTRVTLLRQSSSTPLPFDVSFATKDGLGSSEIDVTMRNIQDLRVTWQETGGISEPNSHRQDINKISKLKENQQDINSSDLNDVHENFELNVHRQDIHGNAIPRLPRTEQSEGETPMEEKEPESVVHLIKRSSSYSWTDLTKEKATSEVHDLSIRNVGERSSNIKRWSLCYGEFERLEFLPKESHKFLLKESHECDLQNRTFNPQSPIRWKLSLWRSHGELLSKKLRALFQS